MNNYGYYTDVAVPYKPYRVNYEMRRANILFYCVSKDNLVIHHADPGLSFDISNERLALIMEHV
jgi:hypothetical protein